jgi:hypothetical protein
MSDTCASRASAMLLLLIVGNLKSTTLGCAPVTTFVPSFVKISQLVQKLKCFVVCFTSLSSGLYSVEWKDDMNWKGSGRKRSLPDRIELLEAVFSLLSVPKLGENKSLGHRSRRDVKPRITVLARPSRNLKDEVV